MKKVFIGVLAALMLFAFTACEQSMPSYKQVEYVTLDQTQAFIEYQPLTAKAFSVTVIILMVLRMFSLEQAVFHLLIQQQPMQELFQTLQLKQVFMLRQQLLASLIQSESSLLRQQLSQLQLRLQM